MRYRSAQSIPSAAGQTVERVEEFFRRLAASLAGWHVGPTGGLPLLILLMVSGFMLVSVAFRASIGGMPGGVWVYWPGLLLLVVPVAVRLISASVTRQERIGLVVLLGLALYGVKLIHSPFAFTYPDELVHYANAEQALRTQHLFGENSILPVTPGYPGLPAVTTAIASLTGLSIFTSGLIVIGAARLLITLGLFLIFEKLSNSSRLASFASVIYMANSNYLYWSAQYAYESLALPLAVFVVFVLLVLVLRRTPGDQAVSIPALVVVGLGILAVTLIHHLTSFALAGLLGLLALSTTLLYRGNRRLKLTLWGLTYVALGAAVIWNLVVSAGTWDYLIPVIGRAFDSGLSFLRGESGRALFQSSGASVAPTWERVVGIASFLLILAAVPFGLWVFWRRLRWSALTWVLVIVALVYFPLQGLRFTEGGWEAANRASEFLFVGIAFLISLAFVFLWIRGRKPQPRRNRLPSTAVVAGVVVAILFAGGVISGWPPSLRMAQPFQVGVVAQGGEVIPIELQGVSAARWALAYLGPDHRMAADSSNARWMQAYGQQYALAGRKYGILDLFLNDAISTGELEIIQETGVEYLVFAYPFERWEQRRGLAYNPAEGLSQSEAQVEQGDAEKFDLHPGVDRLLDTGQVVIYKLGGLADAAQ